MAVNMYLQIKGVQGEATAKGYEKQIEIEGFSFGVSNPVSIGPGQTGAGAGKASFGALSIMKTTDSASPLLFGGCIKGTHWDTATLYVLEAGGEDPAVYLQYDFTMVFAESIQWSGSGGSGNKASESVSLAFGSVKVTYSAQSAQGSATKTAEFGWDITKNAKL